MKISQTTVLATEEIAAIDNAAKRILFERGVDISDSGVLERLAVDGTLVDYDRFRIRFQPDLVQRAIESVPPSFNIYDRDRKKSLKIGAGCPTRFASGHSAIYLADPLTGERVPFINRDIKNFAKLAHYLDNIELVAPEGCPSDHNGKSSILHAVAAVLDNTSKPLIFTCEDDAEVEPVIRMLKAVSGREDIGEMPSAIAQFSPTSPLAWNGGTARGFIRVVEEGLPCIILPGPIAGATSPYTIAGTLAQKTAEVLSGVVIAYIVNKGTPLLGYNGGVKLDMKTQAALFGIPEITLLEIAGIQMLANYGIPSHGCVPTSDSHSSDIQLGAENMRSILLNMMAGASLLVNAGMFADGQSASLEQMVIDDEIAGISRRILEGVRVDKESIQADTIVRVGRGGNFLMEDSTLNNLRSGEWTETRVFSREGFENWNSTGRKGVVEKARRIADEILERQDASLDEDRRRMLFEVIKDFDTKRGATES